MPQALIEKTLAGHPFLRKAPPDTVRALGARAVVRCLEPGQALCGESHRTGRVWFVAEGLLHATIQSKAGSPVTVEVLRPGEAYGYLSCWNETGVHDEELSGLLRSQVVGVPADQFVALVSGHGPSAQALLEETADRVRTLMRLRAIGTEPASQRVRSVLAFLHEKLGRRIPMTRAMIAMVAGLTTETVSRAMAPLRRRRIIQLGRGFVEIVDRRGL